MKTTRSNMKHWVLSVLLFSTSVVAQPHLSGEVGAVHIESQNRCNSSCPTTAPFINLYAVYLLDDFKFQGIVSQESDGEAELTMATAAYEYHEWEFAIGRPAINLGLNPASMAGFITPPSEAIISSTFVRRFRRSLVIPNYGASVKYNQSGVNFSYSYYIENRLVGRAAEDLEETTAVEFGDPPIAFDDVDEQGVVDGLLDITPLTSEIDNVLLEPIRRRRRERNIPDVNPRGEYDVKVNNFRVDFLTENGLYGADFLQADIDETPINVAAIWAMMNFGEMGVNFEHVDVDNVTKFNTISANYDFGKFVPFFLYTDVYGDTRGEEVSAGVLWRVAEKVNVRLAYHLFEGPTYLLGADNEKVSASTIAISYNFNLL